MCSVMNLLTEKDFELIDAKRRSIYADQSNYEDSRYVLKQWAAAKDMYLKDIFKDSLIIEKPFCLEVDEDELIRRFSDALRSTSNFPAIKEAYNLINDKLRGEYSKYWINIGELFNPSALRDNEQLNETFIIENEKQKIKFQKGSKVVRSIGKLIDFFGIDNKVFTNFVNAHSQILNDKKIEGTICYSIHPLDYMTMSDNEEGWSSCMSWDEGGCYCQGSIEMMNSQSVIVAYIKSNTRSYFLNNSKRWNSKKWRTLVVITPEAIAPIKGYPYQKADLSKAVIEDLREMIGEKFTYGPIEAVDYHEGSGIYQQDGCGIFLRYESDYMYNDFGCAKFHYMAINPSLDRNSRTIINYSGRAQCMCCGDIYPSCESSLICDECDNTVYCQCCGDRIDREDAYEHNGDYYCEYCYCDNVRESPITNRDYWHDEFENVYIVVDKDAPVQYRRLLNSVLIPYNEINSPDFIKILGKATRQELSYIYSYRNTAYTTTEYVVYLENIDSDWLEENIGMTTDDCKEEYIISFNDESFQQQIQALIKD